MYARGNCPLRCCAGRHPSGAPPTLWVHHVAVELSGENWKQLWVPPGFAHGYLTLEAHCEVIYKVTDYWAPECERGIVLERPLRPGASGIGACRPCT